MVSEWKSSVRPEKTVIYKIGKNVLVVMFL